MEDDDKTRHFYFHQKVLEINNNKIPTKTCGRKETSPAKTNKRYQKESL